MSKILLDEQLKTVKKNMGIVENLITIPDEPNLLNFFHGGDLDNIDQYKKQKSDRQQFGSGLYLTTYYDIAKKYAKGSRKLYLVSVQKGTDINDVKIKTDVIIYFLNSTFNKKIVQYVNDLANMRFHNGEIPLYIINNILINHNLLKGNKSVAWKNFLMSNGVDYEIVNNAFGFGEDMMVLYNTNLIKYVKRIEPKDTLPTYDLLKK